jgi:hypothetical protein
MNEKPRAFEDPYLAVLKRFNRRGVRYVVVGMSGINYYAMSPAETFGTLDYDVLLEGSFANVKKAVEELQKLGLTLSVAGGIFKIDQLREIVLGMRPITATTPEGLMVELLLKVSGYPFSELARDSATFTVEGIPVRVGRLKKLLQSKRLAGRPKDLQFLKRYQTLLEE